MNPAGFTFGMVDLGRSGEFQFLCVVAVGAGTGGLLITTPEVEVAVGEALEVGVALGLCVVEETAGLANSLCT